jgi:hypothetical protein
MAERASFVAASLLITACTSSPATKPPPNGSTTSTGGASTGSSAGAGGAPSSSGTTSVGGADAGVPYPAPHAPMPQAVTSQGPVMKAPKIVGITFQGDSLQTDVDTFVTQIAAATPYWSGATAEYGVGPLKALGPQHMAETAPATLADSDVQQWLTTQINADAGAFPQPDANTMYVIFYPDATTVTMGGGTLCQDFEGYHSDYALTPGGQFVTYAVVGRCPPPVMGLAEIDEVTAEASHEIIEAATDPLPMDQPAYLTVDAAHMGWALLGGGEIGDLCAAFPDSFYTPTGITSLVQRVWSNAAAMAGHDPCEPNGASPYFNSAPVLTDKVTIVGSPIGVTTTGAKIPIGSSKTIELDLYSDAPTSGPWKVSVLDVTSAFFGGAPALSFKLDKTQGKNGDKIQLTVKALAKSSLGASPFWIQNDLGSVSTVWIGLVGN